jgi:glutamine synthetase
MDPFFAQSTMVILCDILDPVSGEAYNRDPRGTAKKAEAYMKAEGIGDTVYVGPEAEFFVFDDVKYKADPYNTGFKLDSTELPSNDDTDYETGNMGHRPRIKGGYFPVPPIDSAQDMRSEMLTVMTEMGVRVEKHHHEVAAAQHELGVKFDALTRNADKMLIYKYVVHQVANAYGKTATFMPKPVFGDNGSGMHVHMSIWKDGKPTFAGNEYAGLSETCLYYIGGVIKHAKAINAFTNPLTNSYKRLVPGYEAPVYIGWAQQNRSALIRIPRYTEGRDKAVRAELRFPDPSANPYLAFTVMLAAALDGIERGLEAPKPLNNINLYHLDAKERRKLGVKELPGSLAEALTELEKDTLLTSALGDVTCEAFMRAKWEEWDEYRLRVSDYEIERYLEIA